MFVEMVIISYDNFYAIPYFTLCVMINVHFINICL